MKKLFVSLSLALVGLFATSCYDDSYLWDSMQDLEARVQTLETLCAETNANLTSLQSIVASIEKGGFITNVEAVIEGGREVGYKITLNDGKSVVIYHGKDGAAGVDGTSGEDGYVPSIGAKKDKDGLYYWTLDGEWLLDDAGNKIPMTGPAGADGAAGEDGIDGAAGANGTDGITPKLKIEDGSWYVSYDEGATWKKLGAAQSAGGACLFDDVTYNDGTLTFKFSDGSEISFEIGEKFRIELGDFDPNWGSEIEIPYTIKGASGEVSVIALSDVTDQNDMDIYVMDLIEETPYSGKILVNLGWWDDEEYVGRIAIFAVDESGTTVSKILKLTSSVMYTEDDRYIVGNDESEFTVTLSTNRRYEVTTSADWITYVQTKTVEEKNLVFNVQKNEGDYRSASVYIKSGNETITIPVYQKASADDYVFYVNIKTDSQGYGDRSVFVGGDSQSVIRNSKGQTVAEALGYTSWEEVIAAVGDWETMRYFEGDVVVTAYNPLTGEKYGNKPYNTNWNNSGPEYHFDKYGQFKESSYSLVFNWDVDWDTSYLQPYFNAILIDQYVLPGESYVFGVLLSSSTADVRIEVTVDVADYTDPEEGKYNEPSFPGTYTFDIDEQFEVEAILPEGSYPKTYIKNLEIYEIIKSTLGMTSYDLYKVRNEVESYFVFENDRYYSYTDFTLDINGNEPLDYSDDRYEQYILHVYNQILNLDPTNNYLDIQVPYNYYYHNNNYYYEYSPYVLAAAVKNTELKFKYMFEYDDYKLQFNIKVKYIEVETEDPEAWVYDDPAAPGTYEFDIYDKIEISVPTLEVKSVINQQAYENVKETLGMTSYEISRNRNKIESYFLFDNYTYEDASYMFNSSGSICSDWEATVVEVNYNFFSPNKANNTIAMYLPIEWSANYSGWAERVVAAADANLKIKYKYVIKYEDYELIFNHTIQFERVPFDDPEVGLYDDPAAPGKYEFDIVDEYVISETDAGKDSQYFDPRSYKRKDDVWDIIRETLGMTTTELILEYDDIQHYFVLQNGERVDGTDTFYFDEFGNYVTTGWSEKVAAGASISIFNINADSNNITTWVPWGSNSGAQGCDWFKSVYNAAAIGTQAKFKYVIEYGDYELVFNYTIKFVKGE